MTDGGRRKIQSCKEKLDMIFDTVNQMRGSFLGF